jgi:DJ-1/PfpI family
MLSMTTSTAHVALYDNLADWEFGHLLVELRTGRFTGHPWKVVSVAGSREPITSMGGLRMVPDMILDDLDPADSNLLILPGADMWDARGRDSVRRSRRALPGRRGSRGGHLRATAGLVRAGLPGQPPPHQRSSR